MVWIGESQAEPASRRSPALAPDIVRAEVDLVVTDAKGWPVTDLAATDLELFRDGERQEILYFARPADAEVAPATPERSRHVVVFVDNLRLWPKRRNALLRRLGAFAEERLARGDRITIAAFDGSIELLVVDSLDVGEVVSALATLESRPSAMAGLALEARRLRQALAEGIELSALQPRVESFVGSLRRDVGRSLAGLEVTIQALARPGVATSILYLSDGLPAWPGDELVELADPVEAPRIQVRVRTVREGSITSDALPVRMVQFLVSPPRSQARPWRLAELAGATDALTALTRLANRHGASFFPVRPSALLFPSLYGSRAGARGRADPVGPLQRLAEATGGDLLPYGRFEKALTKLSRRLDSTYTVGFQVATLDPATLHRLDVQLARKGLKAHYPRAHASGGPAVGSREDPSPSPSPGPLPPPLPTVPRQ
ncbi:MAG: VWA domain-containing protein [Acidobacteriota bacterium]